MEAMTGWTDPEPKGRPPKRSFAADIMSLGPASTPGRDLIIAILTIAAMGILLFAIFPDRLSDTIRWIVMGAVAAYHVLRFILGIPKWARRR
jgi:hypothetical protein